jgi:thiol:disulfide interchange protein
MPMKRLLSLPAVGIMLGFALTAGAQVYDSHRDPEKDLAFAKQQAAAQHKNILLDVGGNWCEWCLVLDRQLHTEPELSLLMKGFVVVHVNHGLMFHGNNKFLKQFPPVNSFPHLFVLAPDGKILKNVDNAEISPSEKHASQYDEAKIRAFLIQWTPA